MGIIMQSIANKALTFSSFFGSNFIDWLAKFGLVTGTATYSSGKDLALAMIGDWYYFGFAGGVLSLIWASVRWLIGKFQKKDG
jgi:uncharacterized oligopeptide transporter (OPT) family protein